MSQDTFINDLELALLRGLKVHVNTEGRIDPEISSAPRKRLGLSGAFDTVRVIPLSERVTDEGLNPYWEETRRVSYRLGDMLLDSRLPNVQFPGR